MAHAEGSTPKVSTQDENINFSKELPSGHPQFIIEPDVKCNTLVVIYSF